MKKLLCFCLVLSLCLCVCGCKKGGSSSEQGSEDVEKIKLDSFEYVTGEITEIIAPDTLVLNLKSDYDAKTWGETVHVITKEAEEYCVGVDINVKFLKIERPSDSSKPVRIIPSKITDRSQGGPVDKPIIYLYPQAPTECSVSIALSGRLTCTYPVCGVDGWQNFTAYPDGTLVFPDGKEYYALYWEGLQNAEWDFSEGWCVRGKDTASFLEWALAEQGLTPREANEFIIYWLPLMQDNPYNVISFQTDTYTDGAILNVSPAPDSLLRVFMAYYPSDTRVDIQPQSFDGFERQGFTVVEWGGSRADKP